MRAGLLVIAACSAGVPPAAPPRHPTEITLDRAFGIPGEALEYRVTLRGVPVGKVVVAVGQEGWVDGRPAVIVRSRGRSDGLLALAAELTYELTTTIDLARARPLRSAEDARIRLAASDEVEHAHQDRTWSEGDRAHDLHSAAAVIRGWRSAPGERASLSVRIDRGALDLELWHARRERVYATRSIAAVRYEGSVRDRYRLALWISDDTARVPLRLRTQSKWGELVVELVRYDAPPD